MSEFKGAVFACMLSAAVAASATAQSTSTPPAPPAAAIEVIDVAPIHAIVLPMKGSYMQHQQALEKLGSYLAQQGVAPTAAPFGRYFSDPSVGEENLQWEIGFPVPADAKAEAPFEVKDLPGTLAAVRQHKSGYETLGPAWAELVQWVMANGYQPVGPAFQSFEGDFMAPVIEMRLPVQK